jgi:hypothetical protein
MADGPRFRPSRYGLPIVIVSMVAAAFAAVVALRPGAAPAKPRPFNRHAVAVERPHRVGEAPRVDSERVSGPEQERYDNRAYPAVHIPAARREQTRDAFDQVSRREHGKRHGWEEIGPFTPNVPGEATYTGRATTNSGRVTALAVAPRCERDECVLLVGAAGGGVWKTENALDARPDWEPSNAGIPSNAIGSLVFDPTDATRQTLYAGTGEPNGSSDSEAGVGLFKSTNRGRSWSLVPGSVAVAKDRSIAAIAVDPREPRHLYIGTAVARHGSSSVNGGRFTPPGAPRIGVYESTNGGATFTLAFSKAADPVDPTSPNGADFFRGGVSKLEVDRTGLGPRERTRIYASLFDYGLYRSSGGSFEQIFASAGGGLEANSLASRTEFALAPRGTKLRIYVGDAGGGPADFYRVDDANVAAASLTDGVDNLGWIKLSNSTPGTPGFGSYNYCGEQCSYDMPVASPPGQPDVVWIGGQMQYDEIFTATPPSNGRAVQRSANAGVSFTDMTNDTRSPPLGMHPDQHAIAFVPSNPDVAFLGSDGGVVRTSGRFADASAECDGRGLSGADLIDCKGWLKAVPTRITSMNDGLRTLQFQSVSLDANRPLKNLLGGTQDNGTWGFSGKGKSWLESVGGDGGQSGIDVGNSNIRMHTYFGPQGDVNFHGNDPLGWNWWGDPLNQSGEAASFYVPLINDPTVTGTWFIGLQHVWRTKDNGGPQAFLEQHCNEFFGDFTVTCGDWEPLGGAAGDLTTGPASDKGTGYVVAVERAPGNSHTLWTATRRGRVFISQNADAPTASVAFTRIDTPAQPRRFVSGISIDDNNPNHALISFSGYNAYTPTTPGHVFDVRFNPATGKAVWKDVSFDLGDQPITSVAVDGDTGDVFASTDYGVLMLRHGSNSWAPAAVGLPPVAVYGLTIDTDSRLLYAATHGRGIWRLMLVDSDDVPTHDH